MTIRTIRGSAIDGARVREPSAPCDMSKRITERPAEACAPQLLWWLVPPVLGVIVISSVVSVLPSPQVRHGSLRYGLFDAARSLASKSASTRTARPS